jgi:hypothetical protein
MSPCPIHSWTRRISASRVIRVPVVESQGPQPRRPKRALITGAQNIAIDRQAQLAGEHEVVHSDQVDIAPAQAE